MTTSMQRRHPAKSLNLRRSTLVDHLGDGNFRTRTSEPLLLRFNQCPCRLHCKYDLMHVTPFEWIRRTWLSSCSLTAVWWKKLLMWSSQHARIWSPEHLTPCCWLYHQVLPFKAYFDLPCRKRGSARVPWTDHIHGVYVLWPNLETDDNQCKFFIPTATVQPVLTLQTHPFLRTCQPVSVWVSLALARGYPRE
jgi:hypothetical protein